MKKASKRKIKEFFKPTLIKVGLSFLTAAFFNWIIVKFVNISLDKFDNLLGNLFLFTMLILFIFISYSLACLVVLLYDLITSKQ